MSEDKPTSGILQGPDGQVFAWSIRTLPAKDQYPASVMFDVIDLRKKTPVRSVALRAGARDTMKAILQGLASVV